MTIARLACPLVFFASGLAVGVLWSPLGRSSQAPPDSRAVSDARSENAKFLAKMKEIGGPAMAEFARQFEDMTIRIKKNPIDAWASPDGRFVIRLFGSDETIASDLRYPEMDGAVKELVRHYSFSAAGQTWSVDFGRAIKDPKTTNVVFGMTDAKGNQKFSYVDLDADGRWDRFTDYTQEPPKTYVMAGLCWKERAKDAPKKPKAAP